MTEAYAQPPAANDMPADDIDAKADRLAKLQALAERLAKKRDEAVKNKRYVETKWINSLRQDCGLGMLDNTKAEGNQGVSERTPRPHLSRSRADRWEARLCDMLFPSNDLPWDITAPAENIPAVDPAGQPVDPAAARSAATDGAGRMKTAIQSQLNSCQFSRAGRRMIRDAVRIGTGLLMGPMKTVRTQRKFRAAQPTVDPATGAPVKGAMSLEIIEDVVPEIREGDPWCFFPDNVNQPEKAEYAFYVHILSPLEVRNLAPGFDEGQIATLLRKKADLGELSANLKNRNMGLEQSEPLSNRYAVWRYTGALDKEDLELLGLAETGEEAETEMPPTAMADLWFSQDCILRAKLAPIENDFRIPYFVFSPFPRDGSMFGLSIHELCQDSQQVAESAWLIALHNASVSSGPQFIMRRGKIQPKDGKYVIRGPKIWEVTSDETDLNEAMAVVTIPNMVDQALGIMDRATQIMDDELNTAQWASSEETQETPTASGLAMLMNVRSILQVRVATTADSEIFQPVIERMYWWNMLYNDDDSLKGDYQVVPLVQSVRLVKDIQAQHLRWLSMLGDSPRFGRYFNDYEMLKALASMSEYPTTDFIKPKEQADQEAAQQGPSPEQIANQLTMAQAQKAQAQAMLFSAQANSIESKGQIDQLTAQLKAQSARMDLIQQQQTQHMELAKTQIGHEETMRDLDVRDNETQTRAAIAAERETTARMKIASEANSAERKGSADASVAALKTHVELVKTGVAANQADREMALKARTGSGI